VDPLFTQPRGRGVANFACVVFSEISCIDTT
jgi:hypothetical protein